MSGKDKWVRRFSVDETAKHKNGFTIYKITSVVNTNLTFQSKELHVVRYPTTPK